MLMKLKRKYFGITALLRLAERQFLIKHGLVKAMKDILNADDNFVFPRP